jgi:peroxiredoxin Q/BCP
MPVKLNEIVPDFTAKSTHGDFRLADYRGGYLIIYFYPKDATPGCTCEANDFQKFQQQFTDKNVKIVGVSRDTLTSHAKFAAKYNLTFPLIADTDSVVCDLFGVINEKSIFGKTALGLIRSTFLIDPEGRLIQEWRKVKVKDHVEDLLQCSLN